MPRNRASTCSNPLILLTALLALAGCSPVGMVRDAVQPPVDWDFIQSVGGLELSAPYQDEGIVWLPIRMDLSGRTHITVSPTLQNSGLKCWKAEASFEEGVLQTAPGYDIEVRIYAIGETEPPPAFGAGYPDSCNEVPAPLGLMDLFGWLPASGPVRIWYRDSAFHKHFIDEFHL